MTRGPFSYRGLMLATSVEMLVLVVFALIASGRNTDFDQPHWYEAAYGNVEGDDVIVCGGDKFVVEFEDFQPWADLPPPTLVLNLDVPIAISPDTISRRYLELPPTPMRREVRINRDNGSAREDAVHSALKWIVVHQREDGSWSFDHRHADCPETCNHVGSDVRGRTRSTSLALDDKNLSFGFLATGAMYAAGDEQSSAWYQERTKWLIDEQTKVGHETGSWYFAKDDQAERGGRLYCTAMATLIIETYYRHSMGFIHRGKVVTQPPEEDFPL